MGVDRFPRKCQLKWIKKKKKVLSTVPDLLTHFLKSVSHQGAGGAERKEATKILRNKVSPVNTLLAP